MAPSYHDDPSHNAPEVDHQPSSLHAVADYSQVQPFTTTKDPYYNPSPAIEPQKNQTTTQQGRGWRRWWILALFGVLIALIAGLVGGFIGQAIQKGRATFPSNECAPALTPTANSSVTLADTIVNANTGCNFESRERRRIDNRTEVSRTSYTTVCNSEWDSNGLADDIMGFYSISPSDCVEACLSYNNDGANERSCVGAGFVPLWTNRTEARKMINGTPRNCYLKNSTNGISENSRAGAGVEVVALCLEGKCNGIGTA